MNIKYLMVGVISFLAGVGISSNYYQIKWSKIADKEIESMNDFNKRKINRFEKLLNMYGAGDSSWKEQTDIDEDNKVVTSELPNIHDADILDLELAESEYPKDDDEEEVDDLDEEYEEKLLKKIIDNSNIIEYPYVITQDEFDDNFLNHDKINLYFFDEDETLTDDKEEPITDINNLIGPNALYEFINGDTVFVRNEKLGADFEITIIHGSYATVVLNLETDKYEKNKHKKQMED